MKGRASLLLTVATLLAATLPAFAADEWVWLSGSKWRDTPGSYGTRGVPSGTNEPGGRRHVQTFRSSAGDLWFFGGYGWNSSSIGYLNDLWKYDGTDWTWVSGSNKVDTLGVYGAKGVPSSTNRPGGRGWGATWTATDGTFWLFGGQGYASTGSFGSLSDLWKYDGTNWTWVSGSDSTGRPGVYGTKGVAAAGNVPGARMGAATWLDASGDLWLFGGYGRNATTAGHLNDLWRFDGTYWTWVAGSNATESYAHFGTKGVANALNVPGGWVAGVSWRDSDGDFWLFGGFGYTETTGGTLNAMWKYDGTNWTWVAGSNTTDQYPTYGAKGVPAPGNIPGARFGAASCLDTRGTLWLHGGSGRASNGSGLLNDLWAFDGTNWTWVAGDTLMDKPGQYFVQGVPNAGNVVGGRYYGAAWYDSVHVGLRLFGGYGRDEASVGLLSDLWGRTLSALLPPDLTVSILEAPATVDAGCQSHTVRLRVANQGGGADSCRAGVYLSSDAVITTGDDLLGAASVPALAAGAACTLTVAVTLPALAGDSVHVGVIADDLGALAESDEGNNTGAVTVANLTPRVLSILDVKNDQGRWVRIRFARSSRDVAGSSTPVTQYEAFRRIDADALRGHARPSTVMLLPGWEFAGAIPAHGETEYSMVVPTLKDSNATGPGHSVFFLRAATATPTLFFDSCPDSGHSVDNLPPALPGPFAGVPTAGGNVLHWGANPESDLACYRLYRGTDPGFTPGPGNLLAQSADTGYVDVAGTYVYKLSAVDVNDNEGSFAVVQVTNLVAVPAAGTWELSLGPARPNPGSGSRLSIPFTLPAGGRARLELVDVSGRRLAVREVGTLGAGRHTVDLAEGRRLPAGVYLVRLVQGTETRARRVAVLD
jgi:N-acetylneuraminic acid mutarotase